MEFGVGFALIGLIIFSSLMVAESSRCAGTQCLKSEEQEGARNHSSAVASISHHRNDKTDNAKNSMDMENQAVNGKSTKEKESKEVDTEDYGSYNPSPSSRQPPHKLTPNL